MKRLIELLHRLKNKSIKLGKHWNLKVGITDEDLRENHHKHE